MGVIKNFRDVENQIRHRVNQIRNEFDDKCAFTYPHSICIAQSLGLTVKEIVIEGKQDGFLHDRTIVLNRTIKYEERKSFTLFHEVTHHLLDGEDEIISFLMEYHAGKDWEYSQYIERLCNLGAAQFLAPLDQVQDAVRTKKYSIKLIAELDTILPASKPALLFQLAQVTPHKCTLVIVEKGDIIESSPSPKLLNIDANRIPNYYTLYTATSPSNKYRPGRFVTIPKHHILRNAFKSTDLLVGEDYIPYKSGNQNHKCYCEGLLIGSKVYGLFNLEPPHNKDQPALFDINKYL